jgi:DNA-binding LacI/PurR family transcriptional regulator
MTIADVATEAGVSPATVSRVLNDSGYPVRPETRQRVLHAIEKLDFRPNEVARALLLKRTRTVGLVIPDIANPYYPAISRGVEDEASARGYAVIFCNTDRDSAKSEQYVHTLLQKQVEGIIVAGGGTDFGKASETFARTQVVFVGRPELRWPSVEIDNAAAVATGMSHLVELGHRRIAFVGGPEKLTSSRDRLEGYRRSLREHGLGDEPGLVREGDYTESGGYEGARSLLSERRRPTAIFAANDRMAIGALAAASDLELEVPADVSVVGFDDIALARYVRPTLTTLSIPAYDLGATAMRLLLELQERKRNGGAARSKRRAVRLPVQLVIRDSTASSPRSEGSSST